jgi:acetyl esterase/lipase
MAAAAVAGLVVIVRRALAARDVLDAAVSTLVPTGAPRRRPWRRILLWPFPTLPRDVERIGNLRYDDVSRAQRLDLYRPRGRPPDGPTLVYLHGGTFRGGNKRREARPLLHRLARHGWVCVSADYRRAPNASYRDQLIDTKRVIAWVREHGARYGADVERVVVAGSSAGAHLVSTAALTADRGDLQPGFEDVDTSVTAVVALYGYFGATDVGHGGTPVADHADEGAPPVFVIHGDQDTIVIAEDARAFVARLRAVSAEPVVYAELPGAQHDFDLRHSIRFESVVDAVEHFAAAITGRLAPSSVTRSGG